jgi:hypothetical protein
MKIDAWIHWAINDKCNFSCAYCTAGNSWKFDDYKEIDIEKFVRNLEATGKTFLVRFTGGGEPFLVKNLPELCLRISGKHYLGFNTNLIPKPIQTLFEKLPPERVYEILASVHFAELDRQELKDRFVRHGQLLISRGFNVHFVAVAYPEFHTHYPAWIREYGEKGIKVKMVPYVGVHNNRRYPEEYTQEDIEYYGFENTDIAPFNVPQSSLYVA